MTHHDVRLVSDVVNDVVASFGDVVGTTRELPHATPEAFLFEFVPFASDVTSNGDVLVTQIFGGLEAQHVGNRVGVGIKKLLVSNTWRAGLARVYCGHIPIIDRLISLI